MRLEESKNLQTTLNRTYCKRNRPWPYYHPNCTTPRHWKFTQDHRTTRPPPIIKDNVLITFMTILRFYKITWQLWLQRQPFIKILNDISCETTGAIVMKFHTEPSYDGCTRLSFKGHVRKFKMAVMPVYGKKKFKRLLLKNHWADLANILNEA